MLKYLLSFFLICIAFFNSKAQTTNAADTILADTLVTDTLEADTLSKFQRMNKKAEKLFKIIPVPIVSYSTETGSVFGLAKYNVFRLVKGDSLSSPSSFSELISISTLGQFKVVVASNIYIKQNNINIKGGIEYVQFPEYILGIGNDVSRDDVEEVKTTRFGFSNAFLWGFNEENTLYAGVFQEYKNYLKVEKDSNSYLVINNDPGVDGGISSGVGVGIIFDTRDNRYNAKEGMYFSTSFLGFGSAFGSDFKYNSVTFDIRKYFNPWFDHVVAFQAFTESNNGTVPFYSLSLLGGTERMRGYYLGAIRDKVIIDAQVEYRMHIWSVFGIVAFASLGRVAENYSSMSIDGIWYAAGFGLRVKVDSASDINLRLDAGFGQKGSTTFALGFSEAF